MEMESTEMWYIMTQKQQLQIRHTLLLEMQEFLKKNNFRKGNQSVMRQNCMRKGKVFKSCNVARRVSQMKTLILYILTLFIEKRCHKSIIRIISYSFNASIPMLRVSEFCWKKMSHFFFYK